MYYTEAGFKFALIASKNKKNIRDLDALNVILYENGMPQKVEEYCDRTLYIITAQGLNYFKFGITKNVDSRVSTYKSVLKNVQVRFTHQVEQHNADHEKKCMSFLENNLNLDRDSEKFEFRDEAHLQEIITGLQGFLR